MERLSPGRDSPEISEEIAKNYTITLAIVIHNPVMSATTYCGLRAEPETSERVLSGMGQDRHLDNKVCGAVRAG